MFIENISQSNILVQHENSHHIATSFIANECVDQEMCKNSEDCTMNCATRTDTCKTRSRSVLFPAFDENILTSNARTSTENTNGDHIFMINEMLKGVINQCVVEKDEETFTKAKGN